MRQKKERRFNYFQKKIMIIAAGILNIAIVLSAAAVATYAWYQASQEVEVNVADASMQIRAKGPEDSMSYEVLVYDDNLKAGVSYTGSEAVNHFKLPSYDQYIQEKNQYANVIVRAEVSTTALSTSAEEFTIDITRLASDFKTAGVIGTYTSNVIQFKATAYKYKVSGSNSYTDNAASHNSIDETSPATKYATASSYFANKKTPTTFVPIRDDGEGNVVVHRKSPSDTITLIPDLPSGLTVTNVIIYLECTYHNVLVNEFINSHSEQEMEYELDGDISLIEFGKKTRTSNVSDATGKYIKVESDATASSGEYLLTYDAGSNVGKTLKGSLADGVQDINADPNIRQVGINNSTATEPKSIDSTDTIDSEAFTYDRIGKTFKSQSGYYIGSNNTGSNYSIDVATSAENKTNEIMFDQGNPIITANSGKKLQYYNNSNYNLIKYYNTQKSVDLYRYTENVAEMPTLVSIAITQMPTEAQRTFYTEHTFNLNGLEVTATYNDGSTAVVTKSCTFTSPTGTYRTLVPTGRNNPTQFASGEANKRVNISYTEGTVTLTNGAYYTINIVAKDITSIYKEGTLATQYYYVGETFSASGVTIKGRYNSYDVGDQDVDVTSSASFSGYNMSAAGTYTVKASYNGCETTVGTIYVRAKTLTITPSTKTLAEGETFDITVNYNVSVTITNTPGTGTVSANKSSITYSNANKLSLSTTVTVTALTAGTATLTFSGSGVTTRTCTITVTELPADHFTIDSSDIVSSTDYQAYSKGYSTDYNGTGSSSRNWVITFGGNTVSLGTNSNHRSSCNLSSYAKYANAINSVSTSDTAAAFASTDKLYKISKITFKFTGTSSNPSSYVYVIYSTDNSTFSQVPLSGSSTFSQGGTMSTQNTDYTFTFDRAYTGYFAIVFKATNSSGAWRIDNLNLEFNPLSVSSIAIGGSLSKTGYNNGDSLEYGGLTVTAKYSDGSTADVTASSSFTCSPATLTTGTTTVTVSASFTDAKGNTVNTNKVISGITVNKVYVTSITLNKTTASIAVGETVSLSVTSVLPNAADDKTYTWSVYSGGSYASVSNAGVVTGAAAGTAKIRATANDGSGVYGECTVTVTAEATGYTVSFNGNGATGSMASVSNVSGSYTLPSMSGFSYTNGTFKGWTVGTPTSKSYKAAGETITVSSNTTLYARWQFTDTLNRATTGITGTSYSTWSGKSGTSGAVYAGQSAGGNSSIQLRSSNSNSGIITTTSGGYLISVTVSWQSSTSNGRTLTVYGKNSAYSAATDLYNNSNQGTSLGSIVKNTSTSWSASNDQNYKYLGLRSASGAMYLTSVDIVWIK